MKTWLHNRRFLSTKGRVLLVFFYIVLITLFDSYTYGIIYQQKIKQEGYSNPVWNWVFEESGGGNEGGIVTVPRYRVIQKSIEITGLIIVFYFCGIWCEIGLITAHYFMSFDLLFYILLKQTYLFEEFEKYNSTYWLRYPYQAGYFILNPFKGIVFYVSGAAGLAASILFCLIKPKRSVQNQR
jgi:hypothetical protein